METTIEMDDDWGHIIFRQPPYTKNAEWWLEFVSIFGRLWMLLHMRFGFEFPRGVCVCVCKHEFRLEAPGYKVGSCYF